MGQCLRCLRGLSHSQVNAHVVAKKLGMSQRTLARRLAEERITFSEVLQKVRALGEPLFRGRGHADFDYRLALRFRGGEFVQPRLSTVDR